jgi:cobaltochelatase CobN
MQASGYNGARYMADLADSMLLWDQTRPELVTDRDWEAVRDVYLRDRYRLGMAQYFAENNPAARTRLVQTMLDAIDRGAWRADATTRTELEKIVDGPSSAGLASLSPPAPAQGTGNARRPSSLPSRPASAPMGARASASISGYELVPSAPPSRPTKAPADPAPLFFLCLVMLVLLAGGGATKPRW